MWRVGIYRLSVQSLHFRFMAFIFPFPFPGEGISSADLNCLENKIVKNVFASLGPTFEGYGFLFVSVS